MKILFSLVFVMLFFACQDKNNSINVNNNYLNELPSLFEEKKPTDKKILYYDNGTIKCIQEYYFGLKHGIYKNWYKDGTIRTMGIYYMGIRKGVWTWYNEYGKVEFQVNYDKQTASI